MFRLRHQFVVQEPRKGVLNIQISLIQKLFSMHCGCLILRIYLYNIERDRRTSQVLYTILELLKYGQGTKDPIFKDR